jgi:hypothetical protein
MDDDFHLNMSNEDASQLESRLDAGSDITSRLF